MNHTVVADNQNENGEPSRKRSSVRVPWPIIIVFAFFTIAIGVAEYVFYSRQQAAVKSAKAEELSAIADLRVNDIIAWRNERLADAGMIADDPATGQILQILLSDPSNRSVRQELREWMGLLREDSHYLAVLLVDTSLGVIQSSPEKNTSIAPRAAKFVREAMAARTETLTDFFMDDVRQTAYLDLVVPVLVEDRSDHTKKSLGALVLRVDPNQYLYPVLQVWPTPSQTSEVLLARREGDQVVYLNELRHRKQTALSLRLPLSDVQLPAAIAVSGRTGTVEGIDYRGVPVLAVTRRIPDTSWFLVAKVDMEEIEAPGRERGWMIGLVVGLLVLSAGSTVVSLSWNESAKQFRTRYESEIERQTMAQNFQSLTKYANDPILLTNPAGTIIEANDRALEVYGYSRAEFADLNFQDLASPEHSQRFEELMERVREGDGLVFESEHRRVDGTTFIAEVSSRAITVSGITLYQHIIRDITARTKTVQ